MNETLCSREPIKILNSGNPRNYSRSKPDSVVYIRDENLLGETVKIPNISYRNKMVASLVEAYNIIPSSKCVDSVCARDDDLTSFHALSYIEYIKTVQDDDVDIESHLEYGLSYDCPPLPDLYEFVTRIAGGTLAAVRQLTSRKARVAVNWCGGWHHAQRDEAEGFCYVNDIVVGIEELRKEFPYVLYIDLDIHHGNGVENAYCYTKRVLTLSFHKYEPGFYPTTGALSDRGVGPGLYYAVNVPLKEGLSDSSLRLLFDKIAVTAKTRYCPDAVVVQCGADGLTGDPVGNWNLTPAGLGHCLSTALSWGLPTLVLGGGGYNKANTARCWTYLTALICNKKLPDEIPDNLYFSEYGPGFDLEIVPSNVPDMNDRLDEIVDAVLENLSNVEDQH